MDNEEKMQDIAADGSGAVVRIGCLMYTSI